MGEKRTSWFVCTVMVGLLPILARFFAWLVTRPGTVEPVAAADFVAFGLVLHVSIINEMEHVLPKYSAWKTRQIGAAIVGIVIYTVLYSVGLVAGRSVDSQAMIRCSMILALISFLLNYAIYRNSSGDGKPE
jgi:hypothetical protein